MATSASGTASAGDFTAVPTTTLTFASGVFSQTVTVNTTQDSAFEGNETFFATLAAASPFGAITTATGTGTIIDDDVASFLITDASANEGSGITFTVTRTLNAPGVNQTVEFGTALLPGSGRTFMLQGPWLALAPGLCLTVVVYATNMFGDALRDLLDPRMRGSR